MKHRLVDVAVGSKDIITTGLCEENFNSEWLVHSTGFAGDVSDGCVVSIGLVETFECFDDELCRLVLDGD
jgi:hypothetical protein